MPLMRESRVADEKAMRAVREPARTQMPCLRSAGQPAWDAGAINGSQEVPSFAPRLLTVPGLCCSGPNHWQTVWEKEREDCRRIELPDWDDPDPELWIEAIERSIPSCRDGVVLVAHSLV